MKNRMYALLTAQQMAKADALTIAGGTAGITLMEAAGRAVADTVMAKSSGTKILVIAGPGNNGGDGFVAARLLAGAGKSVTVALLGDPGRLRGDAAIARDSWLGKTIVAGLPLPDADVIIDALFGAGLDRDITGTAANLVDAINSSPARVISVDLPSGLDAQSGKPLGTAVKADATCTFFRKKPGHLLMPGRKYCGEVVLAQIGIEDTVLSAIDWNISENGPELWSAVLPVPGATGYKYGRGHAAVLSGPAYQTGAARMTAKAALRAGAGLVTLLSPRSAMSENAAHLTAIMLRQANDQEELLSVLADPRYSSVALGPGLGDATSARIMIEAVLRTGIPAILDADALTAFGDSPEDLFAQIRGRSAPALLTPHDGEFARLFPGLKENAAAKTDRAREAARTSGAIVILKGADTVIAAPDGRIAINANAPPWLATAGSGDVLTGIAAGLFAQHMPAFEAACAAVWLHGATGDEAGPGLTAEDLDQAMRPVIRRLYADVSAEQG